MEKKKIKNSHLAYIEFHNGQWAVNTKNVSMFERL